ncbi:MAG: NAD(P)/FAD-dependent oxidoreductase [Acetobacter sp.]
MAKVAVIGAGSMGLAAAYYALKAGHDVTIYESDTVAGGMAAHFDFDGLSIERFYHFVCKADHPLFALMAELGIGDRVIWRRTSMGYYIAGKHYRWGDPLALLAFPLLSLRGKLGYGLQAFLQTKRKRFDNLDSVNAKDWFIRWGGHKTYNVLWKRLLDLKFFEYADNVSAAWMATRIKRIGTSRTSIFHEQLGAIEGGSQTLVTALVDAIKAMGGIVRLNDAVEEVVSEGGCVRAIRSRTDTVAYEHVISTVPTPLVSTMVPALPEASKKAYDAIRNIGVVCVLLKLKKPVTKHFWLNINDQRIDIPGLVEFSNLRNVADTVVYVPYYMPQTHPKFSLPDDDFINEAMGYISAINPAIKREDLLASHVGRLFYAQPVCEPGFSSKIPPVQTPIKGLMVADTCYYYPEDRGISESIRFAKTMVDRL